MNINYSNNRTNCIITIIDKSNINNYSFLTEDQNVYLKKQVTNESKTVNINNYNNYFIFITADLTKKDYWVLENLRMSGFSTLPVINSNKFEQVGLFIDIPNSTLVDLKLNSLDLVLAYSEGLALSNYQFLEYFTDNSKKNSLSEIIINPNDEFADAENKVNSINNLIEANYIARDLVNKPVSHLNSTTLAKNFQKYGEKVGIKVDVLEKDKIEELGMGGLLAVNKGSIDPPTFTIMTYKPENHKNSKPIVLVGKGVVYDTGGLSLKSTASSMDLMKSDMAGSAAVFGAIYSIAKNNLPYYIIALVPSTDNRPGGNAYAPGDVIKMMSGLTVEVLNTDAEGRMVLADALHYAKRFDPEFVINVATLTGAAAQAVGKEAIAVMSNTEIDLTQNLVKSGFEVFERMVEFPLWEDYGDRIKSDIADIKNIGGKTAGMITAGKFLEKFTDYPFIHLDIAGSAFLEVQDNYRGKNATGSGVRLLYNFISKL